MAENRRKIVNKEKSLNKFYKSFRQAVREVKSSLDGTIELKDAKTWLNELQANP